MSFRPIPGPYALWAQLAAAAVFGVCQALPLLHVMHDSSHLAFGNTEAWWKVRFVSCHMSCI